MPRITPAAVEALRNEIQETDWYSLLTLRTPLVLAFLFYRGKKMSFYTMTMYEFKGVSFCS